VAARTQYARYLSKRAKRIVDMLEHVKGHDNLEGPVVIGKRLSHPEPEGGVRAILGVGVLSTPGDDRLRHFEPLDRRRTTVDGVEHGAAPVTTAEIEHLPTEERARAQRFAEVGEEAEAILMLGLRGGQLRARGRERTVGLGCLKRPEASPLTE
jgi:hypothetical protein